MTGLKKIGTTSFQLLTLVVAGGIFLADLYFLTINSVTVLYLCLLVFSLWMPHRRNTLILSSFCTILIAAGYWLEHGAYISPDDAFSRAIVLTGLWSVTIVATKKSNLLLQLEDKERRIKTIIEEQTFEERAQFLNKTNALQAKLDKASDELIVLKKNLAEEKEKQRIYHEQIEARIHLIEAERANFEATTGQFFEAGESFLELPLTSRQSKDLETFFMSGEALRSTSQRMISRLFQIQKQRAGEPNPFILRRVVESAIAGVKYRAGHKNIGLSYFLDPSIPVTLEADESGILQILIDLLEHGTSVLEDGELTIFIRLLEQVEKECQLHFEVQAEAQNLPESLFQGWRSGSNQAQATSQSEDEAGLLSTVQRCKLLGGKAYVDQESKEGLTAAFALTVAKSEKQDIPLQGRPWFVGKHILVVDSSDKVRRFLNHQLKNWGMQVTLLGSGPEAARWSAAGHFCDLALVDMDLPVLDGLTLAHQLRQKYPVQSVALMVLPGVNAISHDIPTISKPLTQQVLLDLLDKYLTKSKATTIDHQKTF